MKPEETKVEEQQKTDKPAEADTSAAGEEGDKKADTDASTEGDSQK